MLRSCFPEVIATWQNFVCCFEENVIYSTNYHESQPKEKIETILTFQTEVWVPGFSLSLYHFLRCHEGDGNNLSHFWTVFYQQIRKCVPGTALLNRALLLCSASCEMKVTLPYVSCKGMNWDKEKNSCERSCKSHSCGWDQEPVNFVLQFSDPAARLHSRAVSWFPILWMRSYLHAFIFFH